MKIQELTVSAVVGFGIMGLGIVLTGCQTSKAPATASSVTPTVTPIIDSKPVVAAANANAAVSAAPIMDAASAASGTCTKPISGPPPKPAKGSDIAVNAVGKNLGRNIGRNLIAGLGGAVGGGIGQAVAGGLATDAIRTEQDLKGEWNATDGSLTCGCTVSVASGVNLVGRAVNQGKVANATCSQPALIALASWELGHTFTGYDAPLVLKDAKGATLATVNRDGINYFSGTLADGKPLVLWRRSGADVQ